MGMGLRPEAWDSFFLATAGASAALLGLVFVAMSIHLEAMESKPTLRLRARINLQALATVLVGSLAVLIPGQGDSVLGAELILIALGYLGLAAFGSVRTSRQVRGLPRDVRNRVVGENTLLLLQVAAGASLIAGWGPGLYLEAPLFLLGIPVTVFNFWNVIFAPEMRRG